jgi:ankyrin repeat protein
MYNKKKNLTTILHDSLASYDNKKQELETLLFDNPNLINKKNNKGRTPLHNMIWSNNLNVEKLKIWEKFAPIIYDEEDNDGNTLQTWIINNNNDDNTILLFIKKLIDFQTNENKFNINKKNIKGETLLEQAKKFGLKKCTEFLSKYN